MKVVAIVAAVAALAYTANGSPCTDICNGQCTLQMNACEFTGIFGNLCASQNGICTQTCAAACNCADTCAAQCGGEYATCNGNGNDVSTVLSCGVNLSLCSSTCQAQCSFDTFAGIINALTGAAAWILKWPSDMPATTPSTGTRPTWNGWWERFENSTYNDIFPWQC